MAWSVAGWGRFRAGPGRRAAARRRAEALVAKRTSRHRVVIEGLLDGHVSVPRRLRHLLAAERAGYAAGLREYL